ncbi:MAG: dienelactone hydrolase family protein [Myxococcota bacterium]
MSRESGSGEQAVHQSEVELGRFYIPNTVVPSDAAPREASDGATLPGLVLIHDVFGLSDHSQALATDLAAEGFGVLEIDLYRRLGPVVVEDPGEQIRSLSDPEVLADLDLGADWVQNQPRCAGRKVGIVGVCMGGTYSILAACLSDRFSAAAPFYGILSYDKGMLFDADGRDAQKKPYSPIEAAGQLRTPMLASFGAEDAFVPNEDVDALRDALAPSGVFADLDRYVGAGHAFLNRTRPAAFHEDASNHAWARIIPFLRERLA